MVCPVVITRRTSVLVIFMASASSTSTVGPRVFRALRPPRTAFVRGAAGPATFVAAASGASTAAIPIVVIAGETARRVPLLSLHLVWGLAVSLGELDLNLAPANPFPVQVVKSILCIPDIFKRAVLLRPFIFKLGTLGQKEDCTHMRNN